MTDRAKKYLSDILLAIERIELFTEQVNTFEDYQTDLKTQSAVERQLGIIGEAVNKFRKVETDYNLSHATEIINFRNRLIHNYDGIDETIVWAVLQTSLPILKTEVFEGLSL